MGVQGVRHLEGWSFSLEKGEGQEILHVWASGYFSQDITLARAKDTDVFLIPEDKYKYNQTLVLPYGLKTALPGQMTAVNLTKKDFYREV
jgi:L-ascorbate metabolism protein UlaG (beta-lactamase superfamily)